MRIEYHQDAGAALDDYYDNDPELYNAVDDILELLENDENNPILRRTLIRPANAFIVKVNIRRSRPYYLMWIPEDAQKVAFVKYIGPGGAEV